MDNPRARTQPGRNIDRLPFIVASMHSQANPAGTSATTTTTAFGDQRGHRRRRAEDQAGGEHQPARREPGHDPRQDGGPAHRTDPERAQQHAVAEGVQAEQGAGDQRQQRPQRRARHHEQQGAQQQSPHRRGVPDVPGAGDHGADEALRQQVLLRDRAPHGEQDRRPTPDSSAR